MSSSQPSRLPLTYAYSECRKLACVLFPQHFTFRLLTDDYLPRCSECSKLFRSERHLDLHLERKHDALLQPNATVCLGE